MGDLKGGRIEITKEDLDSQLKFGTRDLEVINESIIRWKEAEDYCQRLIQYWSWPRPTLDKIQLWFKDLTLKDTVTFYFKQFFEPFKILSLDYRLEVGDITTSLIVSYYPEYLESKIKEISRGVKILERRG